MFGLLAMLFTGFSELLSTKKEQYLKESEKNLAKIENETRLLKDTDQSNHSWEMYQLNDSDKALRWGAFLLFTSPLLAYFISPELGDRVTTAWERLPPWQADMLNMICIAVFGLKQIPTMVGGVLGSIAKAIRK